MLAYGMETKEHDSSDTSSTFDNYSESESSIDSLTSRVPILSRDELEKKINNFRNTCILQVLIMQRTKEKKEAIEKRVVELEKDWLEICQSIQTQPEHIPFNIDEMDKWTSSWYKAINKLRRQISGYFESKELGHPMVNTELNREYVVGRDHDVASTQFNSPEQKEVLGSNDQNRVGNNSLQRDKASHYRITSTSQNISALSVDKERSDFSCSPITKSPDGVNTSASNEDHHIDSHLPEAPLYPNELVDTLKHIEAHVEAIREQCLYVSNQLTKKRSERDSILIQLDLVRLRTTSSDDEQCIMDSIYLFEHIKEKYTRELDQLQQLYRKCEDDICMYSEQIRKEQAISHQNGNNILKDASQELNKNTIQPSRSPSNQAYMTPVNTRRSIQTMALTPSQIEEKRDNQELRNTFERLSHSISIHNTPKIVTRSSPHNSNIQTQETNYNMSIIDGADERIDLDKNSNHSLSPPYEPSYESLKASHKVPVIQPSTLNGLYKVHIPSAAASSSGDYQTDMLETRKWSKKDTKKNVNEGKAIKEKVVENNNGKHSSIDVLMQAKKRLLETRRRKREDEEQRKQKEADKIRKLEQLKEKQRKTLEREKKLVKSRENLELMLSEEFQQEEEDNSFNKTEIDLVQKLKIDESRRKAQIRARESKKKEEERKLREQAEEELRKIDRFKKRDERLSKFKERIDREKKENSDTIKPINSDSNNNEVRGSSSGPSEHKLLTGHSSSIPVRIHSEEAEHGEKEANTSHCSSSQVINQQSTSRGIDVNDRQAIGTHLIPYDYNYYLSEYPGSSYNNDQLESINLNHQSDYSDLMIGERVGKDKEGNSQESRLQFSPYPSLASQPYLSNTDNVQGRSKYQTNGAFPLSMQQASMYPYHEETMERELDHITNINDASTIGDNFDDVIYNPTLTTFSYDSKQSISQVSNRFGFKLK